MCRALRVKPEKKAGLVEVEMPLVKNREKAFHETMAAANKKLSASGLGCAALWSSEIW